MLGCGGKLLSSLRHYRRVFHDDGRVSFDYSEFNLTGQSELSLEVEMNHYSLGLLAKLHHEELVREGVRSQSVSRQGPGKHLSKNLKRMLFVVAAIVLVYFRFLG